jgi:hypothetical protein
MRFKTLILGTAAAFAMVGGAQAADLAVAAPVGKSVCDAFGVGYYYIPGTDTCLKVSTYIRETFMYRSQATGPDGNFLSQTEASIEATAKWMSAIGEGTIDVQMLEDTGGGSQTSADSSNGVILDHATAKVGGFTFGYQNTIAESVGPWTDFGAYRNDHKTDNFGYIFSMGGVGLGIGVENNNVYWFNDSPDITGVLTASLGGLAVTATAAYHASGSTNAAGEGFNIGATWGSAGGLQLAANFAWSHNAGLFSGNAEVGGDAMSAFAAFQAPIGGGTLLQGTLAWRDAANLAGDDETRAVLAVVVPVAQNLTLSTEGYYDDTGGTSSEGIFFRAKAATP